MVLASDCICKVRLGISVCMQVFQTDILAFEMLDVQFQLDCFLSSIKKDICLKVICNDQW